MRRVAIAALLVAVLVAGVWLWRRRSERPVQFAPTAPQARVERVTPAQRRELATRITDALHARTSGSPPHDGSAVRAANAGTQTGATSARPIPRLPEPEEPMLTLEQVGAAAQKALQDAVPLLADCYPNTDGKALARMTMFSDPDVGTVIDTDQITDEDGKPLDKQVDDCMRDALETLAMPPLGMPGKLQLQFSFRFKD